MAVSLVPVEGKCNAPTKSRGGQKLCTQAAGWGTPNQSGPCKLHGGLFPTVVSHHAQIAAQRKAERALAQFAVLDRDVDPEQALLDLVSEAAGNVAWLGRVVAELAAEDGEKAPPTTWGRATTGYSMGSKLFGPKIDVDGIGGEHIIGEEQRGMLKLYGEWSDRLSKYAKAAIEAGIEKRRVEYAERQGETIVIVVNNVLVQLGLNEKQITLARSLVAKEFRQLEEGEVG